MQVEVNVQDYFSSPSTELEPVGPTTLSYNPLLILPSSETWQLWFQSWLETLQPQISPVGAYELCLRLTNDNEIQSLNAQYRFQDAPTDVLAFAALEVAASQLVHLPGMPLNLGDIVISVHTAYRQAQEQQYSLEQELAWLAAHGLLHLLGWDHPSEERLIQMLNQQAILLKTIGFRSMLR